MARHRILYTNLHVANGGGVDTFIFSLARAFQTTCDVLVACPDTSGLYQRCRAANIPVVACTFQPKLHSPGTMWHGLATFKGIVNAFRPNIVHTNGGGDNTIAAWCKAVSVYRRFSLVRTHHAIRRLGNDPYHYWLHQMVVDTHTYVSPAAMRQAQQEGLRPRRSVVIENGVDTDYFTPQPRDPQLAAALGITADEFILGSCAGLSPVKRLDVLFQACAPLRERWAFKIVAVGQECQADLIAQQAQQYGMTDRYVYAGFHPDVRPYVALFDAGFILSDFESLSYAAREMLAMGKPLLSSSAGGLVENVRDGYNGLMVPPGDVTATRQAVERLFTMDRQALARMAQNARADAVARFSSQRQFARFMELYDSLSTR